ncbi:MAG TPA: HEAT repeat domain-containing protein [Candidatus Sumerlaeota bacterium]|nr:HEAT repeat domain-containing protein [Candidatus Sumerlaeota bacterium]
MTLKSVSTHFLVAVCVVIVLAASTRSNVRAGEVPEREKALIETLKGNASFQEKDKACRELQIIGTQASVPALAALLTDAKLSHSARCVLEPMPYPEATQALRDALPKTSGEIRNGLINTLGIRGDQAAVGDLVNLLESLRKEPVERYMERSVTEAFESVAGALGRIASPEAAKALEQFRSNCPECLYPVAGEASLVLARRLVRQEKSAEAAGVYEALQDKKWSSQVRLGAFAGLLKAQPSQATDRILKAIEGEDPTIRSVAIANIASLKDQGIVSKLASVFPKASPEVQVQLVSALTDCGDAAALPVLTQALAGSSPDVQSVAARALGKIGNASCVEALSRAVAEGGNDTVKQEAVGSLERLRGDGVNAALLASLKSAPPDARVKLIGVLTTRQASDSVEGLLAEAKGPDARVRSAAFKAIGALGTPAHLPALLSLLIDLKGGASSAEAERAVAALSRKIADEGARADGVLEALKGAGDASVKGSLLRTLGGIANAKAFEAVRPAAGDSDPVVQETALFVLADWPNAQALDTLLEKYRKTEDPKHRVVLLRGCVRLLRQNQGALATYRELLGSTTRPEDKTLLLSGLADSLNPEALKVIEPCLKEEAVGAEAEQAYLKVALAQVGLAPDAAREAGSRLAAESKNEAVRKQAAEIVERVGKLEDYLVGWQVAGPFTKEGQTGEALFGMAFPPETKDAVQQGWGYLAVANRPETSVWMLNLGADEKFSGDNRAAYVRTWILSPKAQDAVLELGADDSLKVWWNDAPVYENKAPGAAKAGEDRVKVSLKEGWNSVMLKVVQNTGPWEFCARLRTPSGDRLEGLRVDATHESVPQGKGPSAVSEPKEKVSDSAGPDAKWEPLFNGKDLTGWKRIGEGGEYSVEEGCLVGTQTNGKGGDLVTERDFADFELRVTYRVVWPANSGFWFRYDGQKGYQFDVLKYKDPLAYSGTLYCTEKMFITSNLNEALENLDGWNEARVLARGDAIQMWLNGTKVSDCRDSLYKKGKIGLQVHPGDDHKGMKIIIQKMEIRDLGGL